MKSLEELQAIRDKMKSQMESRETVDGGDIKVVIGMATCGIAAGARPVMSAFLDEVGKRNLSNVKITQVGCLGMCKLEPMVEVFVPGQDRVTYVHVSPEVARKIVANHIVNGNLVVENIIGNE